MATAGAVADTETRKCARCGLRKLLKFWSRDYCKSCIREYQNNRNKGKKPPEPEWPWRWVAFVLYPDRYGNPCKVVAWQVHGLGNRGTPIKVEFPDGLQVEAKIAHVRRASRFLSGRARGPDAVQHQILRRIRRDPHREFVPSDFFDLATAKGGVGQSLARLVDCRAIVRVSRGKYRSRGTAGETDG